MNANEWGWNATRHELATFCQPKFHVHDNKVFTYLLTYLRTYQSQMNCNDTVSCLQSKGDINVMHLLTDKLLNFSTSLIPKNPTYIRLSYSSPPTHTLD